MTRKHEHSEPRERRSPNATLTNTDEFIADLNIPQLPEGIPQRLEEGLRARVNALLFQLREAKREQWVKVLEVRLVREAFRAVLTAHELAIGDADVLYATFRHLVDELGYDATDVGFVKRPTPEEP